jgi:hypothetical protein
MMTITVDPHALDPNSFVLSLIMLYCLLARFSEK